MSDASNYAISAVLGQKNGRASHVIYYASRTLDNAQSNYSTTEKALLTIVFALEKFRQYLFGTKVIVYSDHATLKYLMTKKDAKPRRIRWILLFQEFDLEIRDKSGCEKLVADHLSRITSNETPLLLRDNFPDKRLFSLTQSIPWVFISDRGTHFCNKMMKALLRKYNVTHHISTAYHPQTNGQAKVSNREVKSILEKTMNLTRKDCSLRLHDAFWAYRNAYKIPIGMSPFRFVFGKLWHLPVELEHRAFSAVKQCNFNIDEAGRHRKPQRQVLEDLRNDSYENSRDYKDKTKHFHDKSITRKHFEPGYMVLLYHS
uniref:Integrase catalytic domain-containing protein n=1 Tax=Lactuca sativa TaxID=4236 RepID=A0A9R1UCJ8_LACSA|nr:hypothetical protein LSAT_V11C900495600 [Lactuca sativa]